jgi:hypothetical protein
MRDEPKKRCSARARIWLSISLFAIYALSIGPAHWIARHTEHHELLTLYRPLVHAAEPLGNVHHALGVYVHLFVDECTAP